MVNNLYVGKRNVEVLEKIDVPNATAALKKVQSSKAVVQLPDHMVLIRNRRDVGIATKHLRDRQLHLREYQNTGALFLINPEERLSNIRTYLPSTGTQTELLSYFSEGDTKTRWTGTDIFVDMGTYDAGYNAPKHALRSYFLEKRDPFYRDFLNPQKVTSDERDVLWYVYKRHGAAALLRVVTDLLSAHISAVGGTGKMLLPVPTLHPNTIGDLGIVVKDLCRLWPAAVDAVYGTGVWDKVGGVVIPVSGATLTKFTGPDETLLQAYSDALFMVAEELKKFMDRTPVPRVVSLAFYQTDFEKAPIIKGLRNFLDLFVHTIPFAGVDVLVAEKVPPPVALTITVKYGFDLVATWSDSATVKRSAAGSTEHRGKYYEFETFGQVSYEKIVEYFNRYHRYPCSCTVCKNAAPPHQMSQPVWNMFRREHFHAGMSLLMRELRDSLRKGDAIEDVRSRLSRGDSDAYHVVKLLEDGNDLYL